MKKKIELAMAVCVILSAFILAKQSAVFVSSEKAASQKLCIVIDAGHGGSDPGKVGINGALEKDINLTLALKLQELLSGQKNLEIVLTRDSDSDLASEGAVNIKASDMQNRCQLIADANPIFTVSLHQNSYITSDIKGAQVFYYGQSEDGKKLAETLQNSLIANVDTDNNRMAKANESYYLLKKTPTPTVIVECGFLSNPTEADMLLDDGYQDKLINAIYLGILEYLESESLITQAPTESVTMSTE